MSAYLKRTSALVAAMLLALAVGFGLAGVQSAYAEGGGGLLAGSLQAQADYKSDVVAAPLVDHATDGTETAVDPADMKVSAIYSYTSSTKASRLNEDGTPKNVTVTMSATGLKKHHNAEGAEAYWVGIGIPAAAGNQYACGFGACPSEPEFKADANDGSFEKGETTYDTFYFGADSTFAGKTGYVAVKNAGGYVTKYSVDFTDVYTDAELSRGIYEVSGLEADTGMINIDNADAKAYIKIDNGEVKLLMRVYNANKYDYLYVSADGKKPESTETDKMTAGIPVPADAAYVENGAKKDQVFVDEEGVIGAAGMKYKAMYYELPITQADVAAKKVTVFVRRSPWSPNNPTEWMGTSEHFFTFDSLKQVEDEFGLVDADIYEKYTVAAVEATNKIPFEPGADDMKAYVKAYSAYGELDYNESDIERKYLDFMIPEIAAKLDAADKAIPNIVPEDGEYVFLQTLQSYNYPSIAEGIYSDSLYSGVLTVKDGKMTVTISQRRGSYDWAYLGFPTDALAAENKAGDVEKIPGVSNLVEVAEVWLDHPAGTRDPETRKDRTDDIPGLYKMYTGTIELKSLEKPIMMSWLGSSWYNRSFIFHQANLVPANTAGVVRQIRDLLNYPDQDDPDVTKPLYRIDPAKVTTADAEAITAAKKAYDALSDSDKAAVDSLIVEYGTQSYGRVLENAVWGLEAASPLNNSTRLADGDHMDDFFFSSSKGKSTSDKERTWSLSAITVKGGKATGILQSDQSSTFSSVIINGQTYKNIAAAGEKSKFEIPLALNSTMSFVAVSDTAVKSGVAYQLTVTARAKNDLDTTVKNPDLITFQTSTQTVANPFTINAATGAVSYAKASGEDFLTVDAKTGDITVAESAPAGTYKLMITVAAAGNDQVKEASHTKGVSIGIKKANNTFNAKVVKAKQTIKAGKSLSAAKAFKVTKNVSKGKVTYQKLKGNAKIKVSSKGKITVKKGLKKGNYTIKVRIAAKATANYKFASKTVNLKIVVK